MENKNFNVDEFFTQKLEQGKEEDLPVNNKQKNNKKGIIIAAIAGVMAAVTVLTAALWPKKNKGTNNEPTKPAIIQEDPVKVGDLGLTYEDTTNNENNSQYGNTTGDINKDELVEKDGTIWKDKEAADNSDKVGKTEIDDQDGKYEVKPDGTVQDKDTGYEVKDDEGNVKQEGSNEDGIPAGYAWDEVLGKLVPESEVGKYVYADADYYNNQGSLIIAKGDIVLRERLEEIKKTHTTTKPETTTTPTETQQEETKPTETQQEETKPTETVKEDGVVNSNGTYTIYGVTYKSKEDYHQFLMHPEQYGYYNGMVLSLEDIEALFAQKTK